MNQSTKPLLMNGSSKETKANAINNSNKPIYRTRCLEPQAHPTTEQKVNQRFKKKSLNHQHASSPKQAF